jgi:hypothetical protein
MYDVRGAKPQLPCKVSDHGSIKSISLQSALAEILDFAGVKLWVSLY